MPDQHTWSARHRFHDIWTNKEFDVVEVRPCGCLWDLMTGQIWEPCMAHEGNGHLSALSEQDGLHVARCLVLVCPWGETRMHETDAVQAAQAHWRHTSGQAEQTAAGSN